MSFIVVRNKMVNYKHFSQQQQLGSTQSGAMFRKTRVFLESFRRITEVGLNSKYKMQTFIILSFLEDLENVVENYSEIKICFFLNYSYILKLFYVNYQKLYLKGTNYSVQIFNISNTRLRETLNVVGSHLIQIGITDRISNYQLSIYRPSHIIFNCKWSDIRADNL